MGWLCKQVGKTLNATCTECSPYCISLYDFRDIQREILRTRPKTNNKAWIKLSEAILSIWRDSWEKCIWSSHPAKLLEEFPASKVHLQPATLLTGKFSSRRTNRLYFSTMILKATQLMGSYVHTLLVSWDVAIGQNSALHWEGGKGGGATSFPTNSTKQLFYTSNPLEHLELLVFRKHFLSKDILLVQNLSASKNSLEEPKNRYFQGQIHWVPL